MHEEQHQIEEEAKVRASHDSDRLALLLFRAGDVAPKAVPLSLVARLEDIDVSEIENSAGQPMVQPCGRSMPRRFICAITGSAACRCCLVR